MKRRIPSVLAVGLTATLLGACTTAATRTPIERGNVYYRNANYLAAMESYTEAIRRAPDAAAGWNNRAIARVRLGDLNGAVADYNRALELAPYDPEIYFNRGDALVASGQYGPAVQDFTRAIELSPTYAKAYFNRGTALAAIGQADAARADWLHAVDIEPDPWAQAAMRRAAGLPTVAPVASVPSGRPTEAGTVAPPPAPGTAAAAVPAPPTPPAVAAPPVVATPPPALTQQPAASVAAPAPPPDARALATRAISRELAGDHAGAVADLRAAITMEQDPGRRDAMQNLLRLLESPQ